VRVFAVTSVARCNSNDPSRRSTHDERDIRLRPCVVKVDLFDYELPPERIAQRPLADRTQSRLLVIDRATGARTHSAFTELARHLPPRSLLVLNDTSVIPARLFGTKRGSGGGVEIFLLQRFGATNDPFRAAEPGEPSWGKWTALVSANKKVRAGLVVDLAGGASATLLGVSTEDPSGATWEIALEGTTAIAEGLRAIGEAPLPPYIRREDGPDLADVARYQTVYADKPGAVAAPTAGLHFTSEVLDALAAAGHEIARVTLHVGAGTFLPMRADDTQDHHMHKERFAIPDATADAVARARRESRRVIAIGTTSLRALESAARDGGVIAGEGITDLFCVPGFRFRVVDHLFTNFHQPKSTLFMLVCAFAGIDLMKAAYAEAVAKEYRFLSYGDASLIL